MKIIIFLFVVLCCVGCGNSVKKANDTRDTISKSKKGRVTTINSALPTKNRLIEIWTNGSTENATFDIRKDSIYYFEHLKSYKYLTNGDSIKIYYDDYIFNAKLSFIKDTLVMSSEEGVSKFWKFKN